MKGLCWECHKAVEFDKDGRKLSLTAAKANEQIALRQRRKKVRKASSLRKTATFRSAIAKEQAYRRK